MRLRELCPIHIRGFSVVITIPLVVLTYGIEACLLTIGAVSVIHMVYITDIPADVMYPTLFAIAITGVLLFMVLYIASFQEKKSKSLTLKKEALAAGVAVDSIEMERIQNFHMIYAISMFVGLAATAAMSYLALLVVPNHFALVGYDYVFAAVGVVLVIGLVLDKVIIHPLADGTFKAKVLDPAQNVLIETFQNAASADSEDQMMAGLSDEDKKLFTLIKFFKELK